MKQSNKKIIYQVFPRLFGNINPSQVKNGNKETNGVGKFSAFTAAALKSIRDLGVTHIWYTGVIEHATQSDYTFFGIKRDHSAIVKGKAGSAYAIKDYYDIDPDLADDVTKRVEEFEALVDRTHKAGLKVLIDFVPNHVARQYSSDTPLPFVEDLGQYDDPLKAFDVNNNFYYLPGQTLTLHFEAQEHLEDFEYSEYPAKATGNDCFHASPGKNDWYETIKLNYGVDYQNGGTCHFTPKPSIWRKMYNILLFWAEKGVDGFRCDMAEMVPVEFWDWVIPRVKRQYDVCFIAEVYNPQKYCNYIHQGKFDYLYNKVGLYDTLRAVICGQAPASDLSGCWKSVEGIQERMLNFIENHDEQRVASDFFAGNAQAGIPGMIIAATMNTNPVMIYSGQELGEPGMDEEGFSGRDGRTTIFDYWSVASVRNWVNGFKFDGGGLTPEQKQLRAFYRKLLNCAQTEKTITEGAFYDLAYANEANLDFDSRGLFAFLRKWEKEVLLVVSNFTGSEQAAHIIIPAHAFTFLGIEDNKAAELTDLLDGGVCVSTLTDACPFEVRLSPYSGKLLRFAYK